jgi:hypothetical protein
MGGQPNDEQTQNHTLPGGDRGGGAGLDLNSKFQPGERSAPRGLLERSGHGDQSSRNRTVYEFDHIHQRRYGDRVPPAPGGVNSLWDAIRDDQSRRWQRTGSGQFDVHLVFLLQNATTGADVGTDNVHLSLTLDSTGSILSGTFESTVEDPSGNPLFTASGTFAASRI